MTEHERMMEELCDFPDEFVDKFIRLANAADRLITLYPPYRDNPDKADIDAWAELQDASYDVFKMKHPDKCKPKPAGNSTE